MSRLLVSLGFLLLLSWSSAAHAQVLLAEGSKNTYTGVIAANATDEPMLQINIENPQADNNVEVTGITVTAQGSGHDVNDLLPGSVTAYWDKDGNGRLTTGTANPDLFLGSASFDADNGKAAIEGFNFTILKRTESNILVAYTLNANATAGKTFRASLAANTDIKIHDAGTGTSPTISGAPVQGFLRTVGKGTLTFLRLKQIPDGGIAIPNRSLLPLINVQIYADDVENVDVASFSFRDIGSANGLTGILPDSVKLFVFPAARATAAASSDTSGAVGSFAVDNGSVSLTAATPIVVPRNGSIRIWVTADVVDAGSEVIGHTYQVQIPATGSVTASGASSLQPPNVIGAGTNGPAWEFNYNPIYFTKPNDLGELLIAPSARRYPILAFQARNDPDTKSEKVNFTLFRFHFDGTMNDTAISAVSLYKDTSPFGKYNASDQYLGIATPTADNGEAEITFDPQALNANTSANYLLTADLDGSPANGQTIRASLLNNADMSAIGEISLVNSSMIPSPMNGAYKTVGQPRAAFTLQTNETFTPSIIAPAAANFPLLGFLIQNSNDEDLLFKGVNLELMGAGDETQYFSQFELWYDSNGNGLQETGDVRIGSPAAPVAENGTTYLRIALSDDIASSITRNTGKRFTIFGNVQPTVKGDGSESFAIRADADANINAIGADSSAQVSFTTAAPPFSLNRTIQNPAIQVTNYPIASNVIGCINGSYGFIGSKFPVPVAEDLVIKKVRFKATGTLDDSKYVAHAYVWNDKNRNFYFDSGETYYFFPPSAPFSVNDGEGIIDMSEAPFTAPRNLESSLSVGFDFEALSPPDAQAQLGKTFTGWQIGNLILEGTGARSGRPIAVTNAPGDDQGKTMTFDHGTLSVDFGKVTRTAGPPNGLNIEVFSLYLKTAIIEGATLGRLALKPIGTINESKYIKPGGIKVYHDMNKDGKKDANDYLCGYANPPAANDGEILVQWLYDYDSVFGNEVYSYPVGGKPFDQLLFTVDLAPDAPLGDTLQFKFASTTDLKASGSLSLVDFYAGGFISYVQAPPLIGPVITVASGAVDIRPNTTFLNDRDNQPAVSIAPSANNYEVLHLDAKASPAEDVALLGLTLHSVGTANDVADLKPLGVSLYKGAVQSTNLLTSGTFGQNDGQVTLTNFRQPINLNSTTITDLRLAFSGSGTGIIGKTFNLSFTGADLNASGMSSALAINTITSQTKVTAPPIAFNTGRIYVRASEDNGFILPIPTGSYPRVQKLRFTASRTESLRLEDVEVRAAGTANESTAIQNGALLFQKWNGTTPILMASAPFLPGDNGKAAIRNLNIDIAAIANTAETYSLDVDLNPASTVVGTTLRMDLETTATSVRAVGALTGKPVEVVFDDYAGGDSANNMPLLSGRTVTLSSGMVTLRQGTYPPANATILGNRNKVPLMQIKVEVKRELEGVTITGVSVGANGSADETRAIGNVYLYNDINNDGIVNSATDTLLGTGTYGANNGSASFSNLKLTYAQDTTTNWIIAADITADVLPGQTLRAVLNPVNAITGEGQLTKKPLNLVIGTPVPAGALYSLTPPKPTSVENWSLYE